MPLENPSRHAKTRQKTSPAHAALERIGWTLVGSGGLSGTAAFIGAHPMGWVWPFLGVLLYAVLISLRRDAWLVLLPGLLPIVDLAPWTGQIYFTESDALTLTTLAVVGFQEAWKPSTTVDGNRVWRFGLPQLSLVLLMLASYVVSTDWLALAALGKDPSLLVGFGSPLNGVRLSKGFMFAMLLLPLLSIAFRASPGLAPKRFSLGMLLGLLGISLAALWERWVFPGLSDFASDYRTTALFWEMNVGGAHLDGWIALTIPFLFLALLQQTSRLAQVGLALFVALAGYATFTTFSRGLYAGAAVGVVCTLLMAFRWMPRALGANSSPAPGKWIVGILLALVFGLAITAVFKTGGYRGIAALCGLAVAVYAIGPESAPSGRRGLILAGLLALLASFISVVLMAQMDKGAYLVYVAGLLALSTVFVLKRRRIMYLSADVLLLAGLLWTGFNVLLVNLYWAGAPAFTPAILGVALLLLPLFVGRLHPAWAWRPNTRLFVFFLVGLSMLATLAVMFNTYYAASRLGNTGKDFDARLKHWSEGISMLQREEIWFGIGTGHYPERYYWMTPEGVRPTTHRIESELGNMFLRLSGPRHVLGDGELYRITQRIENSRSPPLRLSIRLRAPEKDATLRLDSCRKHLLYPEACTSKSIKVTQGHTWQVFQFDMESDQKRIQDGLLARPSALSLANASWGSSLEVDDLSAIDSAGAELVKNGNFDEGAQWWFFTSDRNHLPWHAKNMWLHYFIEQGWFGVIVFTLICLAALFRLAFGHAARHPIAPAVAGGLIGLLFVGAFDSLVDAPRLALMIFLTLFVALGLKAQRQTPTNRVKKTED